MTETTPSDSRGPVKRTPKEVLYDALDAASPDAESWNRGYEAYTKSLNEGNAAPKTYWDALDASAPDTRLWRAAWALIDPEVTRPEETETTFHDREVTLKFSTGRHESIASYHEASEDCVLADSTKGVFGVFDGMGGQGGDPAAAANAARRATHVVLANTTPNTYAELRGAMKAAFHKARRAVETDGRGGSTVATAIKFSVIDGERVMGMAHAGDTRLFRYSKKYEVYEELNTDQSDGNIVSNGLTRGCTGDTDEYRLYTVHPGDRIMLCSDGITGDFEYQRLTQQEFLMAFKQESPQDCADKFHRLSKKDDDKSVLIIDVE